MAVKQRMQRTSSAATWKLLVNSFYGGTILNKRNYVRTQTTASDLKRSAMVMDPSFQDMTHVEGSSVHIVSAAPSMYMDTPTHIGKAVLDLAKVRMIEFYYDVVARLEGARLISFDTDAFTFHVDPMVDVANCLPMCVLDAYFDNPAAPEKGGAKVRGTPGLFHLESSGVAARAAGPKMVCVADGSGAATKVSCKGVKRCALPNNPYSMYTDICDNDMAVTVEFPSTQVDAISGAVVAVKRRRTMKRT